jgi:hypothetical protein
VLAGAVGLDQRTRIDETRALVEQVALSQSSVEYADARIRAMVAYTSPTLQSARAPEGVRAGLRTLVQETAAERVGPLLERRAAVVDLAVRRWHGAQREARDAYVAYLDERIAVLRAMSVDLRVLFQPQPESALRLKSALDALLASTPDPRLEARLRLLLT